MFNIKYTYLLMSSYLLLIARMKTTGKVLYCIILCVSYVAFLPCTSVKKHFYVCQCPGTVALCVHTMYSLLYGLSQRT